ncbi:MAG: hypothetical protein ACRC6V_07265 [Bacteroidales bacterium]
MTKKTILFASILTTSLAFVGCSDDLTDENNQALPKPEEDKEVIYPMDFRFITLNQSPSITYITKDTIFEDYFLSANGFQINESPYCVTQIDDRLYITHGGNWADNGIQQVDPSTFKVLESYDFKRNGRFYAMEHIAGDTVVVAGKERGKGYNFMVGSLDSPNFMIDTLETGFEVSVMKRIGNKLFVAGTRSQSNAVWNEAKFVVFDINNITQDGMRTIIDEVNLSSTNSPIAVDKNNNIWIAAAVNGGITIYCIDPKSEVILHEVALPAHISNYNEFCYAIDNSGEKLYLRAYKAIFEIDINNPITPEDPVYEYVKSSVSNLRDLDITPEGTLLFIEGETNLNGPRYVIEIDPSNGWSTVGNYKVDGKASEIFVPKYEKVY